MIIPIPRHTSKNPSFHSSRMVAKGPRGGPPFRVDTLSWNPIEAWNFWCMPGLILQGNAKG